MPAAMGSFRKRRWVGSDVNYVKPGDHHVVTCLSVFRGTCDNCTTGRTVLCTGTTVKMLPGASNRLQTGRVKPGNDGCVSPGVMRRYREPFSVLLRPAIGVSPVRLLPVRRGVAGCSVDDGEVA